jgi:hypothetical protein
MSRTPMAGRTNKRVRYGGAGCIQSAATEFVFRFCPSCAGSQFRVVMSIGYFCGNEAPALGAPCSPVPPVPARAHFVRLAGMTIAKNAGGEDFGYFAPGKAGSNPAFDHTCRGVSLARGGVTRVRSPRKRGFAGALDETDFARSPAPSLSQNGSRLCAVLNTFRTAWPG